MTQTASDFRSAAGLLALQALPRVGAATALKAALGAPDAEKTVRASDPARLDEELSNAQRALVKYRESGVGVISFFDDMYPDRLREIADPPAVLYTRGRTELLRTANLVAVVGTREPTSFGHTATVALTAALAKAGFGIVSGLAKGIDTLAHQTALAAGAPTIAVMGGGLDKVYPTENTALARDIVDAGGLLVSEQPFGTSPRPYNLVARDRIQSGLSLAVVVGQSGIKSGTMHTVRFAASQSRPVFCPVPSPESMHSANDGLRALLSTPADQLCHVLPAWKSAASLCMRLAKRPLASPVSREALNDFVDDLRDANARWNMALQPTLDLGVADH